MSLVLPEDDRLAGWWAAFRADGDRSARDRLLEYYMPLVRDIAGRVVLQLARGVERADLVSYGVFGLLDALTRYEPERNVRFEAYAKPRIQGAMIDELRAIDWVPRSVRTRARAVEKAAATLEATLGRTPTTAEVAAALGVTEGDVDEVAMAKTVALDAPVAAGESDATWADVLADRRDGPPAAIEVERMKQVLAAAMSRLNFQERTVMVLGYYVELTGAQMAAVLGVSESRIVQIHTRAIVRLRSEMSACLLP